VLFGGGYFLGSQGYKLNLKSFREIKVERQLPPDKSNIDFSLFWKVWDTLSAKYFDKTKLDTRNMIYGAISGMVSGVGDPYTVFLPPEESKVVAEDLSGSFEGVGIEIGFIGTQLAVISPLPGSPAEAAGAKPGDLILGIKDEAKGVDRGTGGMNRNEAVQIIRGKAGTPVTLTLMREGSASPFEITIVRAKIDVPSVVTAYVGDNGSVAHVRILKFGAETENEWNKAVREILKKQEVKSMILDVRSNPGGYLQAAVDIVSEFVKTGSIGVIEERGDGTKIEFKTERLGLLTNMPVVVLINKGSASASEILAGAMRDLKQSKLIGETSFGKGTIQEPINLDSGTRLHITIAKWLTPNGTWVHEKGLTPDIEVKDNAETKEDEQILKAIEILKN
jgi:carboxyl-terminal processing protease